MWEVQLKPEIKKELKDPETFAKGISNVYAGIVVAMSGVLMMFILFFMHPEHVLFPSILMVIGLGMAGWGEWMKYKSRK